MSENDQSDLPNSDSSTTITLSNERDKGNDNPESTNDSVLSTLTENANIFDSDQAHQIWNGGQPESDEEDNSETNNDDETSEAIVSEASIPTQVDVITPSDPLPDDNNIPSPQDQAVTIDESSPEEPIIPTPETDSPDELNPSNNTDDQIKNSQQENQESEESPSPHSSSNVDRSTDIPTPNEEEKETELTPSERENTTIATKDADNTTTTEEDLLNQSETPTQDTSHDTLGDHDLDVPQPEPENTSDPFASDSSTEESLEATIPEPSDQSPTQNDTQPTTDTDQPDFSTQPAESNSDTHHTIPAGSTEPTQAAPPYSSPNYTQPEENIQRSKPSPLTPVTKLWQVIVSLLSGIYNLGAFAVTFLIKSVQRIAHTLSALILVLYITHLALIIIYPDLGNDPLPTNSTNRIELLVETTSIALPAFIALIFIAIVMGILLGEQNQDSKEKPLSPM